MDASRSQLDGKIGGLAGSRGLPLADSDPRRVWARAKRRARRLADRALSPVPSRLARNHISLDASGESALREALLAHFYQGWRSARNYSAPAAERDLSGHLVRALERARRIYVPWLDAARPLRGLRVLEIGCGTGSSTVAMAEQGARVTALDIDEGALRVAAERCRLYGLEADFARRSADSIGELGAGAYDLVIFSASLEHMTSAERLAALQGAWRILSPGALLSVWDTPNRLWYFDEHTSLLPFFHWLPNDLAFHYTQFSPRENVRGRYTDYNGEAEEHFLRRGRGVSFHEFDLAIRPVARLKVLSSLSSYRGLLRKLLGPRAKRRYKAAMMAACPGVHEGFFDPTLELVIEKD